MPVVPLHQFFNAIVTVGFIETGEMHKNCVLNIIIFVHDIIVVPAFGHIFNQRYNFYHCKNSKRVPVSPRDTITAQFPYENYNMQ